jgi:hypothetical protein
MRGGTPWSSFSDLVERDRRRRQPATEERPRLPLPEPPGRRWDDEEESSAGEERGVVTIPIMDPDPNE